MSKKTNWALGLIVLAGTVGGSVGVLNSKGVKYQQQIGIGKTVNNIEQSASFAMYSGTEDYTDVLVDIDSIGEYGSGSDSIIIHPVRTAELPKGVSLVFQQVAVLDHPANHLKMMVTGDGSLSLSDLRFGMIYGVVALLVYDNDVYKSPERKMIEGLRPMPINMQHKDSLGRPDRLGGVAIERFTSVIKGRYFIARQS